MIYYCHRKVVMKVSDEYMTGKEVVNLIRKLREKGMSSDEILEIIEYIETHDPKEDGNNQFLIITYPFYC